MIKKIVSLLLVWRLSLFVIVFVSQSFVIANHQFSAFEITKDSLLHFLWPWANFDGVHYISIARDDYGQFQYAFFPLLPLIMHMTSSIIKDYLLIGLLISNVASLIFIYLLYSLWRKETVGSALKTIILFLSFPVSFYLFSLYTESLFLALVVGVFLAYKHKKMWMVSFLGILACTTRLVGIFLIPALLYFWWKDGKKTKVLPWILSISLGFIAVSVFNYISTGDPLYFAHVQPQFGANRSGDQIILLPQVLYRYLKILMTVPFTNYTFYIAAQELFLTLLAFSLLVFSYRKINFGYWLFCAGVLILPTLTGTLSSMPRYILAAFPLFFFATSLLKGRIFYLVVILFLIWQIINLILFANGYWVS